MFVFQGAAKLEPSGTSANVRACEHIAKQGFGQLLAFEISLGRTPLLDWLKCWQMSWLWFFNGIISVIYFGLQVGELKMLYIFLGLFSTLWKMLLHFSVVAQPREDCGVEAGVALFDQLYHFNFKLIIFPPQLCWETVPTDGISQR